MFSVGSVSGTKKKGKLATKGEAQIAKENFETIQLYKNILTIANSVFVVCQFIFYIRDRLSIVSLIVFVVTSGIAWYVWSFMRNIGTSKSGGSTTDLNLDGSISEYAKDIILTIVFAQSTSLIHRYSWFLLLLIPIYAVYKGIMLFFFSPYAQLRSAANQEQNNSDDGKKDGKRKIIRVNRR